jgi:hypothetical protein
MARFARIVVKSGRSELGAAASPGQAQEENRHFMQAFFNKLGIAGELLSFLWAQKLWWLIPLVVMLLLLAALIAFASATSLGPFIYPLI